MTDPATGDKFPADDKSKLESAVNEATSWLDASQEASKEEYEEKQKELEAIANPIMQKLYAGAGGAPGGGFPGGAPATRWLPWRCSRRRVRGGLERRGGRLNASFACLGVSLNSFKMIYTLITDFDLSG